MTSYQPVRECQSLTRQIRDVRYQIQYWPPVDASNTRDEPDASGGRDETVGAPQTIFLLHGWMDIGMSFQFVVDALPANWTVYAPDWRGFGGSTCSAADSYWFVDYLGDLDAILESLSPQAPVNLVGHSMGGNVCTLYAGVRPARVRRLVNLEGVGLRATEPKDAPARLTQWLDQLREPRTLSTYADLAAVVARLRKNNPRLPEDKAQFIAAFWSASNGAGRRELRADPQHKQVNPYLYRLDETLACWASIAAPVLWVVCEELSQWHAFITEPAYLKRLGVIANLKRVTVPDAGHMMHHDQPQVVARLIQEFVS